MGSIFTPLISYLHTVRKGTKLVVKGENHLVFRQIIQ